MFQAHQKIWTAASLIFASLPLCFVLFCFLKFSPRTLLPSDYSLLPCLNVSITLRLWPWADCEHKVMLFKSEVTPVVRKERVVQTRWNKSLIFLSRGWAKSNDEEQRGQTAQLETQTLGKGKTTGLLWMQTTKPNRARVTGEAGELENTENAGISATPCRPEERIRIVWGRRRLRHWGIPYPLGVS